MTDGPMHSPDPVLRWTVMPPPDVVLAVREAPVPDVVPVELRDLAVPVHDAGGALVDWELSDHASGGPPPDVPGVVAAAAAFWAWRQQWEHRYPIGPVRELEVLLAAARTVTHGEPPALVGLLDAACAAPLGGSRLGLDLIRVADEQLADVRVALEMSGGSAREIVDEMPGRAADPPLRSWTLPAEPYLITASTTTQVTVHPSDGLLVETVDPGASWSSRLRDAVHVDLVHGPAVLTDRDGRTEVLGAAAARPLAWLAPTSLRWSVRTIPLVEVWRPLYEALPRIAAGTAPGSVVTVTTRVPLG